MSLIDGEDEMQDENSNDQNMNSASGSYRNEMQIGVALLDETHSLPERRLKTVEDD